MYTETVEHITAVLWIFAYSLSGAMLLLGFIRYLRDKRKVILTFLFWHLNMFAITAITLLYAISVIRDDIYPVFLYNSLLLFYLVVPALVHNIQKRAFPFFLYLALYIIAAISLNIVLSLKLNIAPWVYYIWWLPMTVALPLTIPGNKKTDTVKKKEYGFFRSISKVAYLSLAIPIVMNIFIFLVSKLDAAGSKNNVGTIYAVFYCIFNIPGLVYFIVCHFGKGNLSEIESNPAILEILSAREQDIVRLLIKGKKYREISDELCISISTVKKHTNNIYRKTGTGSARLLVRKMMKP